MLSARTQSIVNRNFLGLKHNQILGRNPERKETFLFYIFADGSHAVMIQDETEKLHNYIFGDLFHCKRVLLNSSNYILTSDFIEVLKAV